MHFIKKCFTYDGNIKEKMMRGIYAYLNVVCTSGFGFLIIIVFARTLSSFEFGVYSLIYAFCIFLLRICNNAINQALIHFGSGKNGKYLANIVVASNCIKLAIWLFFLILIELFALSAHFLGYFKNSLTSICFMPIFLLSVIIFDISASILTARQDFYLLFVQNFLAVFFFSIIAYFSWALDMIHTSINALILISSARFIPAIWGVFRLRKILFMGFSANRVTTRILVKYSFLNFLNTAGSFFYSKFDIFLIGAFFSPNHVASYTAAISFVAITHAVVEPFNLLALPALSKCFNSKEKRRFSNIRRVYKNILTVSLSVNLPIALLLVIFPNFIMRVAYGSKYSEYAYLLVYFGIACMIYPIIRLTATIFNSVRRPEINFKLTLMAALINTVLNIPLLQFFGLAGAAITYLITFVLISIFSIHKAQIILYGVA